jgi:hypothetical protein
MGGKRILEIDPDTGAVTTFEYDELAETYRVTKTVDVTSTLEANKELASVSDGWTPSRDMRHAARIPMDVLALWKTMYGVDVLNEDHMPAVKRLLNSNEWSFLRTAHFKL